MKLTEFLINSIFWLWAFIVPAGILAFLGWIIYQNKPENLPYFILSIILGVAAGIYFAESIRKKYGLVHFFSRINASSELDDNPNEAKEK